MPKKRLKGVVVSNKMKNTVVVRVGRFKQHPKYIKTYQVHKRYKVHDEKEDLEVGDKVIIEECKPLSKEKRWRVVEKVTTEKEKARQTKEEK